MVSKLDVAICQRFRNAVNDSPTISNETEFKEMYNLACAVMDRIDSALGYLNEHWDYPDSETEFVCFIMFACMLNDGVDKIYKKVFKSRPKCNQNKIYFKEFCMDKPSNLNEEECPTDEAFFEYIRSLSFAHPYETSHHKPYNKLYGTQVSPWVVVNKHMPINFNYSEPIGVRTYTSIKQERDSCGDIYDIMFSFDALRGFLTEKYAALESVTQWIKDESEKRFAEWKKIKVDRSKSNVDILKEICDILEMRRESTYEIKTMIEYLECPLTYETNTKNVNEYREYLINLIPPICDSVDNLDTFRRYELERCIDVFYPTGLHNNAHYQLEKIYSYLNERSLYISDESDEWWGLKMAKLFYKKYANKWVYMDIDHMGYMEIKMLITVSLFMECKEQGRLDVR